MRPATLQEARGVVRVVASIGTDGSGETSTGMLMSSDGEVVTNNHGVAGATAVQATVMSTGATYPARVVATSPSHDVALLRLSGASGLTTVTFAGRDAAVGARVSTVGDAHGLRSTLTAATGHVLALGQTLVTRPAGHVAGERLTGMLLDSSDVAIGQSGGPTYGAGGRVVAMTTASVHTARGWDTVAIPVGRLRKIVLVLEGRAVR